MWRSFTDIFRVAIRRQNVLKPDARINSEECKQVRGSEYIVPIEKTEGNHKHHPNGNYEKERQNKHEEEFKDCRPNWESSLVGALGWSSVLVLGWCASQQLCHRRLVCPRPERRPGSTCALLDLVSRYAFSRPLCSPGLVACEKQGSRPDTPYGPITAQQAMDEAADRLTEAQDEFLGAVENSNGVRLMEAGQHVRAVHTFERASALRNAGAAYNLGVCCEKGLGTARSLREAARWYELASSRGHAGAMYNLGVFYARGLGDLAVDHGRAAQLFRSAAELGQPDAARALAAARRWPAEEPLGRALGVSDVVRQLLGLAGPLAEPPGPGGECPPWTGEGSAFPSALVHPVNLCRSRVTSLPGMAYASCIRA